jgi:hypothetical protein
MTLASSVPWDADTRTVRDANRRFYQAFESLTLDEMDPVWAHGSEVARVHPGWPRLVGWDAVRESWTSCRLIPSTEPGFTRSHSCPNWR